MALRFLMAEARAGDAFVVTATGPGKPPWLAVIDGGPPGTPGRTLLPLLEAVLQDTPGHDRIVDLLAVTHVDSDHIGGAIDLLADLQAGTLPVSFRSVWHNSFEDLTDDQRVTTSAKVHDALVARNVPDRPRTGVRLTEAQAVVASIGQGITLMELIRDLGLEGNEPSDDGVLVQGLIAQWPRGGPRIEVIGPTAEAIARLRRDWERNVNKQRNEFTAARQAAVSIDRSVTNLASLVFLLEHEGQSALFTGDARGDLIVQALRATGHLTRGPLEVNALKLPHHGSDRSCSVELFRRVLADHYLISGDGSNGNPSAVTAHRLRDALRGRTATVWMTHEIPGVSDYLGAAPNVTVLVPAEASAGVEISL